MISLRELFRSSSQATHRTLESTFLAVVAIVLGIRFPVKFWLSPPFLMDFHVYHFAANLIATGQGHALYREAYSTGVLYMYAPTWAVLWAPLALFSIHHGAVVWSFVSVGWLVATLWCANRLAEAAGLRVPPWASILTVLLLFRILTEEFGNGQADLWWGGLTTYFVFCELRGRSWLAATSLALSMALKLPSAIFLPYLLLTGRWRTAVRTGACFLVLVTLGALVAAPQHPGSILADWGRCLLATGPPSMFRIGDQSFTALLARLLTADGHGLNVLSLNRITVTIVALIAEAGLFSLIILPRTRPPRSAAAWVTDAALLMILMALASPSCWLATYSVLLFPLVLAISLLATKFSSIRRDPWSGLFAGLAGLCSILTHSKFWKAAGLVSWRGETYVFLVFMMAPLLALNLWAFLRRQRRLG